MCGIFGIIFSEHCDVKTKTRLRIFKDLFILSESRGKEASGFALHYSDQIKVYKEPFPASKIIKSDYVQSLLNSYFLNNKYIAAIGHSRLVTHGYEQFNVNNQPVIKNDMVGVHNGIIVNESELWKKYNDETRISDLDSELISTLIRRSYNQDNSIRNAVNKFYREIYGMTSIGFLFTDLHNLLIATNNGSLHYMYSRQKNAFIFASERIILKSLIKKNGLEDYFDAEVIIQLKPRQAGLIDISNLQMELFDIDKTNPDTDFLGIKQENKILTINEISNHGTKKEIFKNTSLNHEITNIPAHFDDHYIKSRDRIEGLLRCKKCILPETFPLIKYDDNGVCNYCNNYKKKEFSGVGKLLEQLEPLSSDKGIPDCLLPFSGGRDSSYTLHFVKRELKMNPIAFSYDWGVITDLARRNQARMCDRLGIEHILVSADIRKKRGNIKKNVSAWLKKPNLGLIPLFMAGDKQYFYHAYRISKAYDLRFAIMGENYLEKTGFKTAFTGAKQTDKGTMAYNISNLNKMKMSLFYLKEYIKNPSYINRSLIDTIGAFISYYLLPHNYLNIFDFIKWDETLINNTLLKEYDWETDPGTKTTWRIGDGTAAFYNYIYYMVAGFTENDTFRSNQIREGEMKRDEALSRSAQENEPRWDSIKWYCDTIQIDFENTIKTINRIKPIYE